MLIRASYIYLCLIFFSFAIGRNNESSFFQKRNEIKHIIQVHHPGKGYNNVETAILFEVKDDNDFPVQYYMDVESVICYENLCKIVPVRLYWNIIGEYQRYEMVGGAELEKYEGEPYLEEDYEKTHRILQNKNSPFKYTRIDEILTTVQSHDMVDAVAGETLLEMNEEDTVDGASLTCFTLWHWAHGNVVPIIRDLTGQSFQPIDFNKYLNSNNSLEQIFAIEQMTKTSVYNDELMEIIVNQTLLKEKLIKYTINYVQNIEASNYFLASKHLFNRGNKAIKIAVLNSLLVMEHVPSKLYYDALSNKVQNLESYHEITLFLRLMKKKNPNSEIVIENLLPLLKKDIIIARSVYWFLNSQELNKDERNVLNGFEKKHKDKL